MNFILHLEVLPGCTIESAIKDAITLANRLDISVRFEFNGVKMFIHKSSDEAKELERFNRWINDKEMIFNRDTAHDPIR